MDYRRTKYCPELNNVQNKKKSIEGLMDLHVKREDAIVT